MVHLLPQHGMYPANGDQRSSRSPRASSSCTHPVIRGLPAHVGGRPRGPWSCVARRNSWCLLHRGRSGLGAGGVPRLRGLIIRLIIQTILLDPSRSVWSRPDRRRPPGHGSGGWCSGFGWNLAADASSRRISASSRPSDWTRSSRLCSADWSGTGPYSTVSTGSTAAVRRSKPASSESLRRPVMWSS